MHRRAGGRTVYEGTEGYLAAVPGQPEPYRCWLYFFKSVGKSIGNGTLTTKLDVQAHAFSKTAVAAIEAAGGTYAMLPARFFHLQTTIYTIGQ